MQIALLYKDPSGESLEDRTTDSSGSHRKPSAVLKVDSSVLEGKIADLERKLTQRDEMIDKMKSEMEAAQKVSVPSMHNYIVKFEVYALLLLTFSCRSQTQCLNKTYTALITLKTTNYNIL